MSHIDLPANPALQEYEQRLDSAIAEYLQEVEAGRSPDRRRFLALHPELAKGLASFFADEDRVRNLAGTMLGRRFDGDGCSVGASPRPDAISELGIGGKFGDFELLEEIAHGGMGVVFRARQTHPSRVVALKTIRPSVLRPGADAVQRFRIEAEAVARLDHPNIVPIFEMGEIRGFPFLSFRFIDGGDLERHISRLKGDSTATAGLMARVARAVHYAHLRGILHRDLKPSNILVDRRGRPHVTDFGLAKCIEDDSSLTRTGLILGTPSYMAPEQVSGPRGEVTTAVDVYGLGAVLYALLTGRPPFQAETIYETLQQVRDREPVHPAEIDPSVDRDLEAICLKCLEKDPGRRYTSAEAVAEDMESWLGGGTIAARPVGRLERAWRWYRRNRLVARLWAGVAALFLAVPIIAIVAFVRQRGLADEASTAAQKEHAARVLASAQTEDIRWRLVRMSVANGNRLMEKGDTTGALPWFAEALSYDRDDPDAAATHRLRIGTILNQCPVLDGVLSHSRPILWAALDPEGRRAVTASADGTARVWDLATGEAMTPSLFHDGPVHRAEFRGDGLRLVTASADGSVRIWNLGESGNGTICRLVHGSAVRIALFSPDGRWIVSGGFDGTVRVWNAIDGQPAGPIHRLGFPLLDLAFSLDGMRIATGSADAEARIWRLDEGRLELLAQLRHGGPVRRVRFSPDGVRLATASHDGTARIWDGRNGNALTSPLVHSPDRWVSDVEFSRDGARLATASHDGTARIWDAHTGLLIEPKESGIGHSIGIGEASFSPDGSRLVTAGFDGTARIWDTMTGAPISPPFYHGGRVLRARFTPDGYRILTVGSDSTARVWDFTAIGGSAVVVENASGFHHAVFNPDGSRIATAGGDGTAQVWDAKTGLAVTPPLRHLRSLTRVAFSPDGRQFASGSVDGTARVWDAETGRPNTYYLSHEGPVRDLRFSPDGTLLATASADGHARIWDVATGRTTVAPLEHGQEVLSLTFDADGRRLATGGTDGMARVWDVVTGQPMAAPLELPAPVSWMTFRPDGRVLLTACSNSGFADLQAQQWDLAKAEPLGLPLKHGDGVLCAIYSQDGRRIATASKDRTARVWDAATGEPITRPMTHQHQVLSVTFSLDGWRLATSSLDGTARVWDASTGEPLSPPLLHRDRTEVGSVSFQPDGRGLLTAGMDGTARVWDLPGDERPSEVLVLQAQVLSGRRIDQTGGEVPLGPENLLQAWSQLRGFGNTDAEALTVARKKSEIAWHRREARRLEVSGQGTAAAWHLNRLVELEPEGTGRSISKPSEIRPTGPRP